MKPRRKAQPAQIELLARPAQVAAAPPAPAPPIMPAAPAAPAALHAAQLPADQVARYLALQEQHQAALQAACPDLIRLLPALAVRLVPRDQVVANSWNPNSVPPEKMELLQQSIRDNGFCFPVVTIYDPDQDRFVVIDGFHRWTIFGPDWLDWRVIPIVVLTHDMAQRMTATIQFNKARGVHQVDLDADVIRALIEQGLSEEEIADRLKLDLDTIHRYKSLTGIAELFAKTPYSRAWVMVDDER